MIPSKGLRDRYIARLESKIYNSGAVLMTPELLAEMDAQLDVLFTHNKER